MGIVILKKEVTVKKTIVFFIGMMCVAMGMTLFVRSNVGAEPWSLFYAGLSKITGIPLGTVVQGVGLLMVLFVCVADKTLPKPGTILSFIVIGLFANLFGTFDYSFIGEGFWWSAATLAAALLIMSIGLGGYVAADLGEGNIELVQFFIARRLKLNITAVRVAMDFVVALTGFLLGGPLGAGTVISVFAIGPLLTFFMRLTQRTVFHMDVKLLPRPAQRLPKKGREKS